MDIQPDNLAPDNLDDETEFERYRQRTEHADITDQSFSVFEGEWLLRSCILRGSLAAIRTFRSRGIIISPISNQNSKAQILDILRQVTLALQLRPSTLIYTFHYVIPFLLARMGTGFLSFMWNH